MNPQKVVILIFMYCNILKLLALTVYFCDFCDFLRLYQPLNPEPGTFEPQQLFHLNGHHCDIIMKIFGLNKLVQALVDACDDLFSGKMRTFSQGGFQAG